MSKKKTPQEKKEAAYERDHYTFAWHSPRSFPKGWKKKKRHLNRVIRRKSKALLDRAEEIGLSYDDFDSSEEPPTAEFFRKGLSRKRLHKTGVANLREKIHRKGERRVGSINLNKRSRASRAVGFRRFFTKLLQDKDYLHKNLADLSLLIHSSDFQKFIKDEPAWVPKLEEWLLKAEKRRAWQKRKAEQIARVRAIKSQQQTV